MSIVSTCDACGAPVPVVTVIHVSQPRPAKADPDLTRDRQHRPLLLRIPEAAEELRVGRSTMYRLIHDGEIRPVRLGPSTTRIPLAEIEAYVARKLA